MDKHVGGVKVQQAKEYIDRVGVRDCVLLGDHTSKMAFINNLCKRFKENLIYTNLGATLLSLNPYKDLTIYTKECMERCRNAMEVPPHIYAISENAYRLMRADRQDQSILILGESGAGKTEAFKHALHYYVVIHTASERAQTLADRLLQVNHVLDAFGNAKVTSNDNSSRFGKYIEIQFDLKGEVVGGHILNYNLEKTRVVHQNYLERNFHIFYHLIVAGDDVLLQKLWLERNMLQYEYLFKGNCPMWNSTDDCRKWFLLNNALSIIGFSDTEVHELWKMISCVLKLGNVQFRSEDSGNAYITEDSKIKNVFIISQLLGVNNHIVKEALTCKKFTSYGEELMCKLNQEQAYCARDALAKALYSRTFTWLVNKMNIFLACQDDTGNIKGGNIIRLLDMFGFEVLSQNSFEQFCINYCSEKLQQIYIEHTLKEEQEEYEIERILWEPVQYFNNKIICDLFEEDHGIISVLNEECLRPGDASDLNFLRKLRFEVKDHAHFIIDETKKVVSEEQFRVVHYAGEVNYNVNGFVEKNNELLSRNLKEVMSMSENSILRGCFSYEEIMDMKGQDRVCNKLRSDLAKLMEFLKYNGTSYVCCLKPNVVKQPEYFDEVLVRHQVIYLGLMESLHVRKSGFAYRCRYEVFLQRYKSLCPDTWPNWHGDLVEGIHTLVEYLGYKPEEYQLGRTKIFIRFPNTVFMTDNALEVRKQSLATKLQTCWKAYSKKKEYQRLRNAVFLIQAWLRGVWAYRATQKQKTAAHAIHRFIQGFIYRHRPWCFENKYFLNCVRYFFLMKLHRNLPKNVLDKSWPTPPQILAEASELLCKLCMHNMVLKYCKTITPEWMHQLEQKLVASEMFKEKKDSYPQSVPMLFMETRLNEKDIKVLSTLDGGIIKYGVPVTKFDRRGFKARSRVLLLTDSSLMIVEKAKLKQSINFSELKGISVSSLSDDVFILHVTYEDEKQKGDVVLQSEHIIESLTKVAISVNKINLINIHQKSIEFKWGKGQVGIVDFFPGPSLKIAMAKDGHLSVTAPCLSSR